MEVQDCHDHCVQHYWFRSDDLVIFRIYKHFEALRADLTQGARYVIDFYDKIIAGIESKVEDFEAILIGSILIGDQMVQTTRSWSQKVELELENDAREADEEKIERLRNYARATHCGLVLMAGFTEPETPDTARVSAYDVLQELNAGNFLARRSLEGTQASTENDFGDIEQPWMEQRSQQDH